MKSPSLFDNTHRISMHESIDLTCASLYDTWVIAWSGGKDSTTTLTLTVAMMELGKIPRPKKLKVFYADTRQELMPLQIAAKGIIDDLIHKGIEVEMVMAPIDRRYLPYIIGRGVPPPSNRFRWCTGALKIEPMIEAMRLEYERTGEKFLTITGVRQGESAIRDQRIVMSCGRDGAECGQGWYQEALPNEITATLAPLLHWRVCHVWEWLKHWAPTAQFGDWDTAIVADAYGGDEAEEINARTGCVCCPLASKDRALDAVIRQTKWKYLSPLKELRNIYTEMRHPKHRLRKDGTQRKKDGGIPQNPNRMGPLTIEARKYFYEKILEVETQVNQLAVAQGRPMIDILNLEEIDFIKKCWEDGVYPDGWDGNEMTADIDFEQIFPDGSVQKKLFLAVD